MTIGQAPVFKSAPSTVFMINTASTFTVMASGSPVPTLSLVSVNGSGTGTVPGVTFDASSGTLSGTPTATGIYNLVFSANNGIGAGVTQNFTLTVKQTPTITLSASSTTFLVGSFGFFTVTATGFPTPKFLRSGPLPTGVSFNTTTGLLSGTPAAGTQGTYTAYNGTGVTSTGNFTLTVAPALAFSPGITSQSVSHDFQDPKLGTVGSLSLNGASNKTTNVSYTLAYTVVSESVPLPTGSTGFSGTIDSGTGQISISGFHLWAGKILFKETVIWNGFTKSQSFYLTVTDNAPTLAAIANQSMTQGTSRPVTLSASDKDGDALSFTFTAAAVNPLYSLEQKLGLYAAGPASNPYYKNLYGFNEKWLKSKVNGNWYGITTSGNVYAFSGSASFPFGALVGSFGPSVWTAPLLIINATPPASITVGLSFDPTLKVLTITPPSSFTGQIQVTVSVSDGILSTTKTFLVTVT